MVSLKHWLGTASLATRPARQSQATVNASTNVVHCFPSRATRQELLWELQSVWPDFADSFKALSHHHPKPGPSFTQRRVCKLASYIRHSNLTGLFKTYQHSNCLNMNRMLCHFNDRRTPARFLIKLLRQASQAFFHGIPICWGSRPFRWKSVLFNMWRILRRDQISTVLFHVQSFTIWVAHESFLLGLDELHCLGTMLS